MLSLFGAAGLVLGTSGCRAPARVPGSPSQALRAVTLPQPITMEALHRTGGVPEGWSFTVPPGDPGRGRQAFVDLGCSSCHAVQGEQFPGAPHEPGPGPDLTGMGSHHPPEYFAESILNPDAVLVDGPGYLGSDGRSVMPSYPDMTLAQLADLVTYLKSLGGGGAPGHMHAAAAGSATDSNPSAPPNLLIRTYRVSTAQLGSLADWFDQNGMQSFDGVPGLVSFTTYISHEPTGRLLVAVYEFENEGALFLFLRRPDSPAEEIDRLLGGRKHAPFRSPPLYPATGLSWP